MRVSTALARHADLTVVADDQVPPSRARDRLVVRNLPDLDLLPTPGLRDGLRALYVGDLRASRDLFTMVDAVAAAPSWRLDLVGPVAATDVRRPSRAGWRPTPRWPSGSTCTDVCHRCRPGQVAVGAAVAMVLLEPTPAFMAGLPSKLYEYLACGLAVLVTPLPRQAQLVRTTGAGRVVADAWRGS